jgi:hypothetical protein
MEKPVRVKAMLATEMRKAFRYFDIGSSRHVARMSHPI